MTKPRLVQYGDLTPDHFRQHPVWIACHIADYDEPWHDETDEETFRPWLGAVPVGSDQMFLVACAFTLADGAEFRGFATPAAAADDLGTIQPQLLDGEGRRHGFWLGMFRDDLAVGRFREAMRKPSSAIFPIAYAALPGLTDACCAGKIPGFMTSDKKLVPLGW